MLARLRIGGRPTRSSSVSPSGEGETERLEGRDISVHFGGVAAVNRVDVTLSRGEILGLIGPNGAGKTTLVNALSGFESLDSGRIVLAGRDVTSWSPQRLAQLGLSRSFQNIRLFREMTVLENVECGGVGVGMGRRPARARGRAILERLQLGDKARLPAKSLAYGDERRLGIARALAMNPLFLLLDEPAAGLNELECDDLMETIVWIRDEIGCGVLVIEHDMRLIMRVSERIQVLDHGQTIAIGSPAEIQSDPAVIAAYLGTRSGRRHARG